MKTIPILQIRDAVCRCSRLSYARLRSFSSRRDMVYARAVFSKIAADEGYTVPFIGKQVCKSRSMTQSYITRHADYMRIPEFRDLYLTTIKRIENERESL